MRQPSLPAKSWPRSTAGERRGRTELVVAGRVGVVVVDAEQERVERLPGKPERQDAEDGIAAHDQSSLSRCDSRQSRRTSRTVAAATSLSEVLCQRASRGAQRDEIARARAAHPLPSRRGGGPMRMLPVCSRSLVRDVGGGGGDRSARRRHVVGRRLRRLPVVERMPGRVRLQRLRSLRAPARRDGRRRCDRRRPRSSTTSARRSARSATSTSR